MERSVLLYQYNDGGRSMYFRGKNVGDCACRAISIALGQDYKKTYDELNTLSKKLSKGYGRRSKNTKYGPTYVPWFGTARLGLNITVIGHYLEQKGWEYVFGKRNMDTYDFPLIGTYIASTPGHVMAVINGVVHDTYKSNITEEFCYGYYRKKQ